MALLVASETYAHSMFCTVLCLFFLFFEFHLCLAWLFFVVVYIVDCLVF